MTLNFIRALVKGGFADLHHPEYFDLDWVQHSPLADEYHRMAQTITEALRFMEHVLGVRAGDTDLIDFFTAHEALHLGYESAQTRSVPRRPGYFNLTTHFPWVGLRTNHPDDAHVEYLRGIENPIGIKVGTESGREHVARWLETLDPRREPGRLTLIHRFGVGRIADALPPLVEAVRAEGGQRGVDLRPDAWQHARHGERREDAQLRGHLRRGGAGIRHSCRDGADAGRCAHRGHRRECHASASEGRTVRVKRTWRGRTNRKWIRG